MSNDDAAPLPEEHPDYQSGFNAGKNDGWLGRWAPPEKGNLFYGNEVYLKGYRAGWAEGRKNPKPKGQLPPSTE